MRVATRRVYPVTAPYSAEIPRIVLGEAGGTRRESARTVTVGEYVATSAGKRRVTPTLLAFWYYSRCFIPNYRLIEGACAINDKEEAQFRFVVESPGSTLAEVEDPMMVSEGELTFKGSVVVHTSPRRIASDNAALTVAFTRAGPRLPITVSIELAFDA